MCPWVALIVLAAAAFCPSARGDGIFSARTGPVTFPHNVQDPKYAIKFRPLSSNNPVTLAVSQELIPMTAANGQKYACILPGPTGQAASTEEGSNVEEGDVKSPEDLINNLAEKPCYYQLMSEYFLGMYNEEATLEKSGGPSPFSADQSHLSHVYTNGTECDLTRKFRQTEVRYVCSDEGRDELVSLKEGPTCQYTLIFGSEDLCNHKLFKKVSEPINTIECHLLPREEEEDEVTTEVATNDLSMSQLA